MISYHRFASEIERCRSSIFSHLRLLLFSSCSSILGMLLFFIAQKRISFHVSKKETWENSVYHALEHVTDDELSISCSLLLEYGQVMERNNRCPRNTTFGRDATSVWCSVTSLIMFFSQVDPLMCVDTVEEKDRTLPHSKSDNLFRPLLQCLQVEREPSIDEKIARFRSTYSRGVPRHSSASERLV